MPMDGGEDGTVGDADASQNSNDASADAVAGQSTSDAEAGVAAVPTPPRDFIWYVLDETIGTTAHDSSSHHFDINVPGVTWNQGGIFDGMTSCGGTTAQRCMPLHLLTGARPTPPRNNNHPAPRPSEAPGEGPLPPSSRRDSRPKSR
jgi:hypothetical protein